MTMRTTKGFLFTAAIMLLISIRLGGQSAGNSKTSKAMPPASIPTFSTENLGRMAHFYVGGHYVGAPGKEQMDGAMYVEVWVPKQIRQPRPRRTSRRPSAPFQVRQRNGRRHRS